MKLYFDLGFFFVEIYDVKEGAEIPFAISRPYPAVSAVDFIFDGLFDIFERCGCFKLVERIFFAFEISRLFAFDNEFSALRGEFGKQTKGVFVHIFHFGNVYICICIISDDKFAVFNLSVTFHYVFVAVMVRNIFSP